MLIVIVIVVYCDYCEMYQMIQKKKDDGYTISDAVGNWKGEREQTKIVSICTEYKDLVQKAANLYKEFFEQDAVAISTLPALEMV